MRTRWPRDVGYARWLVAVGIIAASLAGAGCSSEEEPRPEHLLVRTASGGTMDVTDTAWESCMPGDPGPGSGTSNRTTMSFGVDTWTITGRSYATEDCTGTPVSTESVTAPVVAQGDRTAGWGAEAPEAPPPGLPAAVTATAVLISGPAGSPLPPQLKTLLFVNDLASPRALHFGGKIAGPDGYPTTLETTPRPLLP